MRHTQRDKYLEQLSAALASTPESTAALGKLVATLEQQWPLVEGAGEAWEQAYWLNWPTLEEVYAVEREREADHLDGGSQKLVLEAIQNLQAIMAQVGSR